MSFKLLNSFIVISFLAHSISAFSTELSGPPRGPCQTGIPSPLRKPKDIVPLGCERPFTIRGETYSADSPQAQDASTLKYFVQNVPSSNQIMDEYQSNRNLSTTSAYIGTMGVIMFLLSNTIGNQFNAASKTSVSNALRVGGVCIAAGGFFFTFAYLHDNEYLIPKAVEAYNTAKPNEPIELQFTTGWRF
jgi:hypothetical protein